MTINTRFVAKKTINILSDLSTDALINFVFMFVGASLVAISIDMETVVIYNSTIPILIVASIVIATLEQIFDVFFHSKAKN